MEAVSEPNSHPALKPGIILFVALVATSLLIIIPFWQQSEMVIYWVHLIWRSYILLALTLLSGVGFLTMLGLLIRYLIRKRSSASKQVGGGLFALMSLLFVMSAINAFFLFFSSFVDYTTSDTLRTEGRVYHLARTEDFLSELGYEVYRCEPTGIFCRHVDNFYLVETDTLYSDDAIHVVQLGRIHETDPAYELALNEE